MKFSLVSASFDDGTEIPLRHSCQGKDSSPPLSWSGVPNGTRSLALVVDDPDAPDPKAPATDWVHWVLYDLPPEVTSLPESVTSATLPYGTREGQNDWRRTGWNGPCPPVGRHRYFFTLYALDETLGDLGPVNRAALLSAAKGHVLGEAKLMGTYEKRR